MEKNCYRGLFIAHRGQMKAHEKGRKEMAIDGYNEGSNKSHNRGEKHPKRNGMQNKLSQKEIDKEIVELKYRLKFVDMILEREYLR